jgi:hypothetical protein
MLAQSSTPYCHQRVGIKEPDQANLDLLLAERISPKKEIIICKGYYYDHKEFFVKILGNYFLFLFLLLFNFNPPYMFIFVQPWAKKILYFLKMFFFSVFDQKHANVVLTVNLSLKLMILTIKWSNSETC